MSETSYIKLARLILVAFENAQDRPLDLKGKLERHFQANIIENVNLISKETELAFTNKLNHHIGLLEEELYTMSQDDKTQLNALLVRANNIATMVDGERYAAYQIFDSAYQENIYNEYWPVFKGSEDDTRLRQFREQILDVFNTRRRAYGRNDAQYGTRTIQKLERIFPRLKYIFERLYQIPLNEPGFPDRLQQPGAQVTSILQLSQQIHTLNCELDKLQPKTY